jgi:phenylpropionate dioxygenase-like ring-hydroxylating dioxygenase large terminal subunit
MLTATDLAKRIGPLLPDGTAIRDLIDFEKREISMRVNHDPDLHNLELKRVFARSWIVLGHESEIPNPGDFVTRYHGEDLLILTRTKAGDVSALLNVCAHRGMEICWADEGNQAQFKCPYHGWVYDGTGNLLGAPFEQEMYGDWDKSQYGLRRARLEVRHGLLFVNFDEQAPPLDEWLGDMGWYLDHAFGGVEWEPIGGQAFRFKFHGNWKTIADQNAGDLYHIASAHRALQELEFSDNLESQIDCVKVEFPGLGHNAFGLNPQDQSGAGIDVHYDAKYQFEGRSFILFLFPINQLGGGVAPSLDGGSWRLGNIATFMPTGPGTMEYRPIALVEKDTPEEVREMTRRTQMLITGMLIDDADMVSSITRNARGAMGSSAVMRYNAHREETRPDGWPGPGRVYAGFSRDDTNWDFWKRWFDLLTDDDS